MTSLPVDQSTPEHHSAANNDQIVLILVGIIASGKSTFAQALEQHLPRFRRCNQDDLGDRRKVEQLARQSLREGFSVCIDRQNFDPQQRSHWIKIAHEFPGIPVWIIVFDTPYEVCAARLQERTLHPTVKTPEQGLTLLSNFSSLFQPPTLFEEYDRMLVLAPSDHPSPEYTHSDITSILQRVQNAPTHSVSYSDNIQSYTSNRGFSRGSSNHGYSRTPRGRGRGYFRSTNDSRGRGSRASFLGSTRGSNVAAGIVSQQPGSSVRSPDTSDGRGSVSSQNLSNYIGLSGPEERSPSCEGNA